METTSGRACELAWLIPWWRAGRLQVGESGSDSSARTLTVHALDDLFTQLRRISREVWENFGVRAAVSLEGLGDPAFYVTLIEDRWHFWYLADDGNVSLVSVGDETAKGITRVIFNDFEEIPNTELVSGPDGEMVLREWFGFKRLSNVIRWRER